MSAPAPLPATSLHGESDRAPLLGPAEARALLRNGFERFRKQLLELVGSNLESTDDLFDADSVIPDGEIEAFRQKREEWLGRFGTMMTELFERRMAGERRKGRRPDADASAAALRVLTAFDHEKQTALTRAAQSLSRFTQREVAALELRVGLLLEEVSPSDLDNPFAVPYLLDALGSASRAVYPSPGVWRPLMERLLTDITPSCNGLYIALNRYLADHGVLPDIKAVLRARSEHRPADDRDLLATFTHMLHNAGQATAVEVAVPEASGLIGAQPGLDFSNTLVHALPQQASEVRTQSQMVPSDILAGLAALAVASRNTMDGSVAAAEQDFPSLDPLMALGTSSPLFATLAQWQKLDLPEALGRLAPRRAGAGNGDDVIVPRNLVPHIRAAVAADVSNPADAIAMDVIGLLFDYIFRDPNIAESTRELFGRLQVPIVKAALLDRSFFSEKSHPARQLLDDLAAAAIGAFNDDAYRVAFEQVAGNVIDRICSDFEIDVAIFRDADRELLTFMNDEHQKSATALSGDVAEVLQAEEDERDRAEVRAVLRDRLAGHDIPFEVRSFIETTWAEYLALLRKEHGADSPPVTGALTTLDNALWSIVAKERTAQRARLSKIIPALIASLRTGCQAVQVPPERSKPFFETMYGLHIAAIKPAATLPDDAPPPSPVAPTPPPVNVHDYVGEIAIGTWLQFDAAAGAVDARLNWVSPLRTKYIFTSRSRSHAFILTPEELAYRLGSGTARLVAEPVPLWDRAVSSALDSLAARQPPSPAAGTRTPALA
jgi:hypothetical protein